MTMERIEEEILNRQNTGQLVNPALLFATHGSAGANDVELARILAAYDFVMNLLGWQGKPVARLTAIFSAYQASIDTRYHDDHTSEGGVYHARGAESKGKTLLIAHLYRELIDKGLFTPADAVGNLAFKGKYGIGD